VAIHGPIQVGSDIFQRTFGISGGTQSHPRKKVSISSPGGEMGEIMYCNLSGKMR